MAKFISGCSFAAAAVSSASRKPTVMIRSTFWFDILGDLWRSRGPESQVGRV